MRRLLIAGVVRAGCAHAPATTTTKAVEKPKKSPLEERLDRMTASLEREDFAGALKDTDEWLPPKPEVDTEQLIYNCRTWIRWGGGDKSGAVAENEKLRQTVASAD